MIFMRRTDDPLHLGWLTERVCVCVCCFAHLAAAQHKHDSARKVCAKLGHLFHLHLGKHTLRLKVSAALIGQGKNIICI